MNSQTSEVIAVSRWRVKVVGRECEHAAAEARGKKKEGGTNC